MTPDLGDAVLPATPARWTWIARQILPWFVAAGCVAYSFEVVPLEACLAALRRAQLARFVPLAIGAVLAWFALESAAYAYAFSRFNARLSWREARSLRALTYLLTLIHWHVAKAVYAKRPFREPSENRRTRRLALIPVEFPSCSNAFEKK